MIRRAIPPLYKRAYICSTCATQGHIKMRICAGIYTYYSCKRKPYLTATRLSRRRRRRVIHFPSDILLSYSLWEFSSSLLLLLLTPHVRFRHCCHRVYRSHGGDMRETSPSLRFCILFSLGYQQFYTLSSLILLLYKTSTRCAPR